MSSSLTMFQAARPILTLRVINVRVAECRGHATHQYYSISIDFSVEHSRDGRAGKRRRNGCEGLVLPFAWPLSRGRLGLLGRGVAG
jgi:hypothetical protein